MATNMEAPMLIMFNIHVGVYMHVNGVPLDIPTPTCQPPRGDPRISQNSITLELIKIIQFEDLNFVENPQPMGGCIVWWVVGWVDGLGQVKSLKI